MTFTRFPSRRKHKKRDTGRGPIKCRGHLQWVRGHVCSVAGCPGRPIEAHHVKTRGAGGGDEQVVPLCWFHHDRINTPGWSQPKFERVYGVDLKAIAAELWKRSPHRIKHERNAA